MSTGRTRVELWSEVPSQLWRVVEQTGLPVYQWTSADIPDGTPVDGGGFANFFEAYFHKLGIDYIRAEAGDLHGVTAADIDLERLAAEHRESRQGSPPSPAELDAFGIAAYERRKIDPRVRRRWNTARARELALAL